MFNFLKEKWLAPKQFYQTSGRVLPWLYLIFILTFLYGVIGGLFIAPPDYQQGDGFRIIYVHVPSAFTAMFVYFMMAMTAFMTLVFRIKIAAIGMACSAPIGASFTFLALVTGSLWGKPMWGTWWIWDARLTSVLILLFLYLGFMALRSVIMNAEQRDRASAIIALVGVVNLPIIHYSVTWWNTLHQGATISQFAAPKIASVMLYPLLSMICAFLSFYIIILFLKMRNQIVLRDIKIQLRNKLLTENK